MYTPTGLPKDSAKTMGGMPVPVQLHANGSVADGAPAALHHSQQRSHSLRASGAPWCRRLDILQRFLMRVPPMRHCHITPAPGWVVLWISTIDGVAKWPPAIVPVSPAVATLVYTFSALSVHVLPAWHHAPSATAIGCVWRRPRPRPCIGSVPVSVIHQRSARCSADANDVSGSPLCCLMWAPRQR